jgi:hypothetical protein
MLAVRDGERVRILSPWGAMGAIAASQFPRRQRPGHYGFSPLLADQWCFRFASMHALQRY